MTRRLPHLASVLVVVTFALLLVSSLMPLLNGLAWPLTRTFSWMVALPFLLIGALIARRQPDNCLGWIFLVTGLAIGLAEAAHAYAELELNGGGELATVAAVYTNVSWIPFVLIPGTFLILLFPDGRLLSRRWRPVAWSAAVGIGGALVTTALTPGPLEDFPQLTNPYGWTSPLLNPLAGVSFALLFAASIGSAASAIVRFRRAVGERRLQMQWLAFAAALAAFVVPIAVLGYGVWGEDISNVAIMLCLVLLPVAAGMAILRYRLYDIDVIVNRTLVYGALTAFLALFYLGTVVVLQGLLDPITKDSDIAIAGSTLAVAALFRPLRSRVQDFIDRSFYRRKYNAAETLGEFSARLRDQIDLDSLTGEVLAVVSVTMQPAHAALWLRQAAKGQPG